jgi:hypothetical protein
MQKFENKGVAGGATAEVVENKDAKMTGVDENKVLGLKDVTPAPLCFS